MAQSNQKPADPAERIAEAARVAYEDANGDMREAARRLEGDVRRSRALRDELTDPLISAACWDAIRQQCRTNRSRIWHTPVSVAPNRPQLPAQTSAPKADAARVIQLAAGNLLLFPLPGGRPLGQATRQEIAAAADFYANQAADMGTKARWLALVAEAVPEGRRAGQVLNEARLRELRGSPMLEENSEFVGLRADDGGGRQSWYAHQGHQELASPATTNTVAEIREQWRRRQAWHRAEKALTLQAKALCRRLVEGDRKAADSLYGAAMGKGSHPLADVALAAIFPLTEARDGIERHRRAVERRLEKLAGTLPVAPWVKATRGVGLLSLAAIVGEAGDLGAYRNHSALWKRLGLAVMPDGGRQRRVGGADALDHGYSPARRSVVWNIGACIVKAGGPLKAAYDARKIVEAERVETKSHAHNRAQRYVEKRFIRSLWREWRRCAGAEAPIGRGADAAPAVPLPLPIAA